MTLVWKIVLCERQQSRMQVCEKIWARRITGVKRVERWKLDHLREECAFTKKCLMGRSIDFILI